MDATDLARWTRFALKGGIGKCTALHDCVAQGKDDLMFLAGDEITVLMNLGEDDLYLGYCEDVVGRFYGKDVRFHAKLKKPVIQKRSSSSTASAKSVSPVPSPAFSRVDSSEPSPVNSERTNSLVSSGRLSLPPPSRKSPRVSVSTSAVEDTKNPQSASTAPQRSSSGPVPETPTSVNGTPSPSNSLKSNRRRGGLIDVKSLALPKNITTPDEIAKFVNNEYPFPKPPPLQPPLSDSPEPFRQPEEARKVNTPPPRRSSTPTRSSTPPQPKPSLTPPPPIPSSSTTSPSSLPSARPPNSSSSPSPLPAPSPAPNVIQRDQSTASDVLGGNSSVLSLALSEEDGETGIGLRLLAGLADGDDTSSDEDDDERSEASVYDADETTIPTSADMLQATSVSASSSSDSKEDMVTSPLTPDSSTTNIKNPFGSPASLSFYSNSEANTTMDTDDGWDGGLDIYDNYRYSRYSIKSSRTSTPKGVPFNLEIRERKDSEASSKYSNASQQRRPSVGTITSVSLQDPSTDKVSTSTTGGTEDALEFPMPPVTPPTHTAAIEPLNIVRKASTPTSQSLTMARATGGQMIPPPLTTLPKRNPSPALSTTSSSSISISRNRGTGSSGGGGGGGRQSQPSPSPLLHTAFASPQSSISPGASVFESGGSTSPLNIHHKDRGMKSPPLSASPSFLQPMLSPSLLEETGMSSTNPLQSGGGVASALRAKLEAEKRAAAAAGNEKEKDEKEMEKEKAPATAKTKEEDPLMKEIKDTEEAIVFDDSRLPIREDGDESVISTADIPITPPLTIALKSPASPKEFPPLRILASTDIPLPSPGIPPMPLSPMPNFPPAPDSIPKTLTPPADPSIINPQHSPFLPHPFAPKAPADPSKRFSRGPAILLNSQRPPQEMYAQAPPRTSATPPNGGPRIMHAGAGTPPPQQVHALHHILREVALSYRNLPYPPPAQAHARRGPTIHGRTITDLSSADGPVPISFVVDVYKKPKPEKPPVPSADTQGDLSPPNPRRQTTSSRPSSPFAAHMRTPPPAPRVLSRQNFTPIVGAPRPRSRSFSGFDASQLNLANVEGSNSGSQEQLSRSRSPAAGAQLPVRANTTIAVKVPQSPRTSSPLSLSSTPPSAARPPRSVTLGPSPLGLSLETASLPPQPQAQIPIPQSSDNLHRSTTSPAPRLPRAMSPAPTSAPPGANAEIRRAGGLRHFASSVTLRTTTETSQTSSTSDSEPMSSAKRQSNTAEVVKSNSIVTTLANSTITNGTTRRASQKSLKEAERQASIDTTRSTELSHYSESTTNHHSPVASNTSPVGRTPSVKRRISFGHLKHKPSGKSLNSKDHASSDQASSKSAYGSTPVTPLSQAEFEEDKVQVKDMEFEMVRPVMRHAGYRESEDSIRDALSTKGELRPDVESFRSLSPSTSAFSPDGRSPAGSSVDSFGAGSKGKRGTVDPAEASREAHRTRELKWINTMSSIPSDQARKNKKIRKMLQEPVPDSVRYLVWAHVIDAKAKRTPEVYLQMGKRSRVPATEQIQKDADRCFQQHPHLRDPNGPLVSVVNAYLVMVPDIRYTTGLTVIVGHLLLQAPEEDAFWIFLAMMDAHVRPYYSLSGSQLEADSSLFGKAVETQDPGLAQRLFVDLAIRPVDLCRVWFPYMFAGSLPNTHLHRVWDIFLYEGPVFLFRVGLAVLHFCRMNIFNNAAPPPSSTIPPPPQLILSLLLRPPPELLPADPEQFIDTVVNVVKLKDDDIRKQRLKIEASLRTQSISSSVSGQSIKSSLQGSRLKRV